MIRVLLVEDSITVRKAVTERLHSAGIEVVGEAVDGGEALEMTRRLHPDVILMDVVMPTVDGLEATRRIMSEMPTPIIILSAHSNNDEVFKTYDALACGALEVCAKPIGQGPEVEDDWRIILSTIRAAKLVATPRFMGRLLCRPVDRMSVTPSGRPEEKATKGRVIVIGASTGGPAAVAKLLSVFSEDYPYPIIVAIHCSRHLKKSSAKWFSQQCRMDVRDVVDGERLDSMGGTVLIVPPARDVIIVNNSTVLAERNDTLDCAPSINRLFRSVSENRGDSVVGVILTGMGDDGADGLLRIRESGGITIAQDRETSVIYGMPGAAVERGAARYVLSIEKIAEYLLDLPISSALTKNSMGV